MVTRLHCNIYFTFSVQSHCSQLCVQGACNNLGMGLDWRCAVQWCIYV